MVIGYDRVYVETHGTLFRTQVRFSSEAHLREVGEDAPLMTMPRLLMEVISKRRLPEGALSLDAISRDLEGGVRRRAFFFQIHAELTAYLGDHEIAFDARMKADT